MDSIKTAYAYARFSSDLQREESIDAQLRAIREYCEKNGIRILREFKDEAVSAKSDKRPSFQDLFGLIEESPADFVIVHKLDRFARNRFDAAIYRSKLKKAGMRLISVLEPIDDSPESIIMEGMLEAMNEYYIANLSREVKKGMRENALKGKRSGAHAPTGYDAVDQRLVPNADASRVKTVFKLYTEGKPQREITKATGFPDYMISHIVRNEAYLGTLIIGETRCENAHEPLIDPYTWEQAQKRVHNASMNAANKAKRTYLLSGLLVCGVCGKALCGQPSTGYEYYGCKTKGCRRYRKAELEKRVVDWLSESLAPTSELKARIYDLVNSRGDNREEIEKAKKERIIISGRINSLITAVQYAPSEEEVRIIMQEVKKLRDQMPEVPSLIERVSREQTDAFCDRFFNLKGKTPEEQKIILHRALKRITVFPDHLILDTGIEGGASIIVTKRGVQ